MPSRRNKKKKRKKKHGRSSSGGKSNPDSDGNKSGKSSGNSTPTRCLSPDPGCEKVELDELILDLNPLGPTKDEMDARIRDQFPAFKKLLEEQKAAELREKSPATIELEQYKIDLQLLDAVKRRDTNAVRRLLQRNADPNFINNKRSCALEPESPLILTCRMGLDKEARLLLEYEANPNTRTCHGITPLIAAENNPSVVKLLTQANANLGAHDQAKRDSFPARLLDAASRGHSDVVEKLLRSTADPNSTTENGSKETALHIAVREGHAQVVMSLINAKVDVNRVNAASHSPLFIAVVKDQESILRLLIQNQADMNISHEGDGPLHTAIGLGYTNVFKTLVGLKADVNQANTVHGGTLLHLATRRRQQDSVELLIAHNAKINTANHDGDSPLFMAAEKGLTSSFISLLIRERADVNQTNKEGASPLAIASKRNHIDVVKVLIENKAWLDNPESRSWDPLHIARQENHDEIFEMLITACDIKRRNGYKDSILHSSFQISATVDGEDMDFSVVYATRPDKLAVFITVPPIPRNVKSAMLVPSQFPDTDAVHMVRIQLVPSFYYLSSDAKQFAIVAVNAATFPSSPHVEPIKLNKLYKDCREVKLDETLSTFSKPHGPQGAESDGECGTPVGEQPVSWWDKRYVERNRGEPTYNDNFVVAAVNPGCIMFNGTANVDFMRPLLLTSEKKPCAIAWPKDSFAGGEIGCGVKLRAVMEELNNQEEVYNMDAIFRRFAQMEELLYRMSRGDNPKLAALADPRPVEPPTKLVRSKSAPAPATTTIGMEKVKVKAAGDMTLEDLINEKTAEDSLRRLTKQREEESLKSLETGSLDDDDFDLELPSGNEASQLIQEMHNLKNLRPELLEATYVVRPVLLHAGAMDTTAPSTTIHCPTNTEEIRGRHSVLADLL